MNIVDIYKNVIATGEYRISDMEERIETIYAQGKITAEERASLIALANDSARDTLQIDVIAKLADLESRIAVLESAAVSELPVHAAIMFTSDGVPVMHQKYTHVVVQEEVEPETPEKETPTNGE